LRPQLLAFQPLRRRPGLGHRQQHPTGNNP
jgi:hypothetical protein